MPSTGRGIWRRPYWYGRRGLGGTVLDLFGGPPSRPSACSEGDGDMVTINYHSTSGGQTNWLGQGTFKTYDYYVSLVCNTADPWTVTITFPDYPTTGAYTSFAGSLTETSAGVWTFIIPSITLGDGCYYQLAGSFNESECA